MSKRQHTPGPWRVESSDRYSICYILSNDGQIASTYCERDYYHHQLPDAYLIAAAPDLLAACKLAKQHLDAMRLESGMGNVMLPFEKAAFEQVDRKLTAAITKAEGEGAQ